MGTLHTEMVFAMTMTKTHTIHAGNNNPMRTGLKVGALGLVQLSMVMNCQTSEVLMLTLIEHPPSFKEGTRVLMLKSRHKDGITKEREVTRITHSITHFDREFAELLGMAQPNERIYASAGSRDISKAVRMFKHRQLDADYDDDPHKFYRALMDRWISVLMDQICQEEKFWLFDCDSSSDAFEAQEGLRQHYDRPIKPYTYETKSGWHVITQPFDPTRLTDGVRSMIHKNPIILWAY
jgi:hypothetical protein